MVRIPKVADLVHYVSYGTPNGEYQPEHRAAIISAVSSVQPVELNKAVVDLVVLNPTGLFFNQLVSQDEDTKVGGTWHWPERED